MFLDIGSGPSVVRVKNDLMMRPERPELSCLRKQSFGTKFKQLKRLALPDTTARKRIIWKVDLQVYLNRSIRVQNWAMSKSKLLTSTLRPFRDYMFTPASSRLNMENILDRNRADSKSLSVC